MKLIGLLIIGAAAYAVLNVSSLGLLAGIGGAVLALALGLACLSCGR